MDRHRISLYQAVVLLLNMLICDEANNHSSKTIEQIIQSFNQTNVFLDRDTLEHLLYCSNMNHEDGKFYHPQGAHITTFIKRLLHNQLKFDYKYNRIKFNNEVTNEIHK